MGHVPNQAVLFAMMIGIVAAMGCAAWKAPVEGQEIRRKSGRVVRRAGAARPRRRLTHAKPTRPRTGATSWPIFFPLQVTHATRKFCPDRNITWESGPLSAAANHGSRGPWLCAIASRAPSR
jgi:hypothetical protein